jgi:hypothetical protein
VLERGQGAGSFARLKNDNDERVGLGNGDAVVNHVGSFDEDRDAVAVGNSCDDSGPV